jgi:lipase chaperone LimK
VSKTRALWVGAAVLGIAASVQSWRANERSVERSPSDAVAKGERNEAAASKPAPIASHATAQDASSDFAMERSSLRGTEIDGGVSLDANGDVLPDLKLRRLFDYHLSLIGERDLSQIRQLLAAQLTGRYGPRQTQAVLTYFDRYAGYLQRLAESRLGQSNDPQERLTKVAALRRQMLGETMAAAFFAEEEALAALTLKRMDIAADDTLSAGRKSELLADLDLAEGVSARAEADTASMVADQNRGFEQLRSTQQQRAAEREALWGKEAAQRLAQLDEARAGWDARIEAYLSARARIDADRTLSAAARAQAIATLRNQRFDAAEQRRIASLEAIGQLKPGG